MIREEGVESRAVIEGEEDGENGGESEKREVAVDPPLREAEGKGEVEGASPVGDGV